MIVVCTCFNFLPTILLSRLFCAQIFEMLFIFTNIALWFYSKYDYTFLWLFKIWICIHVPPGWIRAFGGGYELLVVNISCWWWLRAVGGGYTLAVTHSLVFTHSLTHSILRTLYGEHQHKYNGCDTSTWIAWINKVLLQLPRIAITEKGDSHLIEIL